MTFRPNDLIIFTRDMYASRKQVAIHKGVPVTIKHINKHHVWVTYNSKVFTFRNIPERMELAPAAAQALFKVNTNETDT